jgi:hypothetical protein
LTAGHEGVEEQGRGNREEGKENATAKVPRGLLEARFEAVLAALSAPSGSPTATERQAHLALVKRWYYRPEARREGEIFFPAAEGGWPVKSILRGIGRVAAKGIKSSVTHSPDLAQE